ncbi:hypothetical protein H6G33_10000 [Calothrix sp. FACHB-1219]|uniref:hypothetical protein n=1 Tax=unclassified Calothrix TaxID=2619626 RepID=UPI0016874C04|nr:MULTISPECIES: hypothetical protein [unclassified Calothrix]MBD2201679.1 hypothetical protein [Calothrix sp. FACHB-168]MBD2217365.1 hypothetical protein [Calothrix sp. FACHB-1219]
MLLDQWIQYSPQYIYLKGYTEDFFPFTYLDWDEVKDAESEDENITFLGVKMLGNHTDKEFPNYSYHLVLRNSRLIAKGYGQNRRNIAPQLPGTILVIDSWKYHHVTWDKRLKSKEDPLWISACFDSNELISRDRIIEVFNNFLEN